MPGTPDNQQKPKPPPVIISGRVQKIDVTTQGHFESTLKLIEEAKGIGPLKQTRTYIDTFEQVGRPPRGSILAQTASIILRVLGARGVKSFNASPIFENGFNLEADEKAPTGMNFDALVASFQGHASEITRSLPVQGGGRMPIDRKTTIDGITKFRMGHLSGVGTLNVGGPGWNLGGRLGRVISEEEKE